MSGSDRSGRVPKISRWHRKILTGSQHGEMMGPAMSGASRCKSEAGSGKQRAMTEAAMWGTGRGKAAASRIKQAPAARGTERGRIAQHRAQRQCVVLSGG